MQGLTPSSPNRRLAIPGLFVPGLSVRSTRNGGGRSSKAVIVVASLVFHAVALGLLAYSALGIDERYVERDDRNLIPLDLEPRPLLRGETARARPTIARDRPALTQPPTRSAISGPSRPLDRPDTAPFTPRLAATPPADTPAPPDDPWRLRPEDLGSAIGRSLRGGILGCRGMAAPLTAAEQAACDQQLGQAAARAGPPGPRTLTAAEARREAGFARDGARALARYEAQRAPLAGGVGVVGPADCIGSNFGTGCAGAHLDPAIRQGATTNIRQRSNQTDAMRPIPGAD